MFALNPRTWGVVATVALMSLVSACAPAPAGQTGAAGTQIKSPSHWLLDNERSSLSFVSIKAADLPETHRFTSLSGTVSDDGSARVSIDLASVDTGIEIRDERMREIVFAPIAAAGSNATAVVTTQIDLAAIQALPVGSQRDEMVELEIEFGPVTLSQTAEMTILKMASDEVVVTSRQPLLLNAGLLGIGEALDTLQALAGLPSISRAVPVDVQLTYVGALAAAAAG
ncbi:MAG: YceI family protein [Pseudomonadaceae bacterium]|nr:YceI family protein [Pseudomonadaceae bacterium]